MIKRKDCIEKISQGIANYPVTVITGPRQCGKTTIAREIFKNHKGAFFDLEDPECPLQEERAKLVLQDIKGLVVIDEVQRQPSLFSLLRTLADRPSKKAKFLILGSASPNIIKGVSESLAGRSSLVKMSGFGINEIKIREIIQLWSRGGFPLSFLAKSDELSYDWRRNFVQTFLERDIPQLGIKVPAATLRRFWTMVAHFHGNVWNAADFARSLGKKEDTARHYLDILSGTFVIRQLPPWYENIGKRLIKSSKIYIKDTGILHFLLGIENKEQLISHPKLGFSWEGYAIEQIIKLFNAENNSFFYGTHGGAELDLLIMHKGKKYGFEFKYMDAPHTTKSMFIALKDLNLEKLFIIYPGNNRYPLKDQIEVVPLKNILQMIPSKNII